jgi:phage shock protein A
MGIIDRLSRLIRSNLNDLIARAENPEKMLVQVIEDMRKQLAQAKQEVAVAIADERKLRAQMEEERKQAQEWERRARLAIREGRDDLAKQALMRGQENAAEMKEQWEKHRQETERLKDSLRQLNSKIEEAKRKKNLLIAKQKRAQAQKRIHETMAGMQNKSAFRAFDQMVEKIEESERKALAAAEVTEDLEGDSLTREFAQLEAGGEDADVEDKLLALKRDMGLLGPASEEEEPKALGAGEEVVTDAEIIVEETSEAGEADAEVEAVPADEEENT